MAKKSSFNVIATTIILMVFLFIVLIAMLGPDAILPKAAEGAEKLASGFFAQIKGNTDQSQNVLDVEEQSKEAYENLLTTLRSEGTGPCLISYEDIKLKDNAVITLENVNEGVLVSLYNKDRQVITPKTVGGKSACVVGLVNSAEQFYNNFLDGTVCTTDCKSDDHSLVNIRISHADSINIDGKEYDLDDNNLMYKAKSGNVCFFPTYSGWFTGWGCDSSNDGLDNDCIKEIQKVIPRC